MQVITSPGPLPDASSLRNLLISSSVMVVISLQKSTFLPCSSSMYTCSQKHTTRSKSSLNLCENGRYFTFLFCVQISELAVQSSGPISLVITHLDVLQQVVHVCGGQSIEEGVRFMHLHRQIIVFSADVFCQQVDGLRSAVTDPDLRPASHHRNTLQMVQSHVCMKTLHV